MKQQPRPLYVRSLAQISCQAPLSDAWLSEGQRPQGAYVRAQDPDFKPWLSALEGRRMGRQLKRAVAVSATALACAGLSVPDAIVTGTGLGCVESTERFLDALCRDGESLLSPAHFMQSTHNTISSLIAIRTRCHGYNATFSHKSLSFDFALKDASMLLLSGRAASALVGGYDEVTPVYHTLLCRAGYVGHAGQVPCTETAMAALLAVAPDGAVCRLDGVQAGHIAAAECLPQRLAAFLGRFGLAEADVDGLVYGFGGVAENDALYAAAVSRFPASCPRIAYKALFGENFSASALGFYAACRMLQHQQVPTACLCGNAAERTAMAGGVSAATAGVQPLALNRLLVINCTPHHDFSFTLLSRLA